MRRLFLTYCFIVPGLVSCCDRFQDSAATDEDAKVYLAAEVRSGSGTRAPYVPTEDDNTFFDAPTYDKPLYAYSNPPDAPCRSGYSLAVPGTPV